MQRLPDAFAGDVCLSIPCTAKQREKRPLVEQIQIHRLAIEQRKKAGQCGAAMIVFRKLSGCRGHFLRSDSSLHRTHTDPLCLSWIPETIAAPQKNGLRADRARSSGKGFKLRGRIHTDDDGRYSVRTIKPAAYGAPDDKRPSHIHLKASAEKSSVLTTQLYFKGDPWNLRDPSVRPSLIMAAKETSDGLTVLFHFVIKSG